MKKISVGQRRLVADYFSNIGVAWFVAGVIGIFVSGAKSFSATAVSFSWGVGFSAFCLRVGLFFMKGIKA